jgi:hypothetical protein
MDKEIIYEINFPLNITLEPSVMKIKLVDETSMFFQSVIVDSNN